MQVALRGDRPGSLPLRAFAPFLAVQHPGELVASSMLIYSFRLFERRWGSAKFAAFGIETTTGSCLIQLALQRLLRLPCSPGPYGFLFAAMVPFSFEVRPGSSACPLYACTKQQHARCALPHNTCRCLQ